MSGDKPKYRTLREKYPRISDAQKAAEARAPKEVDAREAELLARLLALKNEHISLLHNEYSGAHKALDDVDVNVMDTAGRILDHASDDEYDNAEDRRNYGYGSLLYALDSDKLSRLRQEYEKAYDRGRELQMQHDQAVARLNQR